LLPRPDLTYEKKKNKIHDAATKFKFLYKINQRNNQSKSYLWMALAYEKIKKKQRFFFKLV